MKTRKELLNKECTRSEYYSDFINPAIISTVSSRFTKIELTTALNADEHLNSIPLSVWDGIGRSFLSLSLGLSVTVQEKGDILTLSGLVCIAKEAARQIIKAN